MMTDTASPRDALVKQLLAGRAISSPAVEAAMRTVPRHLFLPGTPPAAAYADDVVITHREADGTPRSSASQPSIVAMMLEQLQVQPGNRILEIGAGTGYNAALLHELTGPDGLVATIDIEADVTTAASRGLESAGYPDVKVITGDGALGFPEQAPYDRLIVTAGAWDIPPAWWHQLASGGRVVVPLRWRGLTRTIAFDHTDGRLISRDLQLCGFIPMRGLSGDGEHVIALAADESVHLHYDEDQPIDPALLDGVLSTPRHEIWSGVTVGPYDPFDGVWLRAAHNEPGTCRIAATPAAVETGLATPAIPSRSPALVEGDSIAYFTTRRREGVAGAELGATGHGDPSVAQRLIEVIQAWGQDREGTPAITMLPADTSGEQLADTRLIDKRHSRLLSTWP